MSDPSQPSAAAPPFVSPRAVVAASASIGRSTRVWDASHVEADAVVGSDCVIGRGVTVGRGVRIGDRCKVQNGALVYDPAVIADGVFIGPGAVLTNDNVPRAIDPDGSVKSAADWDHVRVTVAHGASIGAGAVCVAPVTVGEWSMVAAGSVVTKDVPAFALVAGVPARRIGWVGRAGVRLVALDADTLICPKSGDRFRVVGDALQEASA